MTTHKHNETTKAIISNPAKVRDLCRLTLSVCWFSKVCGAVNIEFEGQHFTLAVSIIGDGKGGERTWINDSYMTDGKINWLVRDMKMNVACVNPVEKKEKKKKKEKREYEELSDEQVQAYYANCLTTRQGAGGHGKAHYNGLRVERLLEELNARGQKPDGREGVFNGEGSY